MVWRPDNSNGNEASKIRWELVPYTRGRGLDLGCGPWKAFKYFIGVDNNIDEHLFGIRATDADIIQPTCEVLDAFAAESMDFVFSSHLLEHIRDHKSALREWWRVIKIGGHLCLYLPHKDLYPNIGTPMSNPDHKHDFVQQDIIDAMAGLDFDISENQLRDQTDEYSFFLVFRKLAPKQGVTESYKTPKPEKSVAIVRYGAYGDCLQTASVVPLLKEQGYHITWFCTPRGYEAIKHDPNIDRFILQDENQVPAEDLAPFCMYWEKKFTRFLNFCEAVEGFLLPAHDRAHFFWAKEARHSICNYNYVELQHRMAGVPYEKPLTKFHRTPKEAEWAKWERRKADGPVVLWALSGSSAHKVWPYVDQVIAEIFMKYPKVTVVLVGGPQEKFLEAGWENEKRVWRKCGDWDIRRSLSFAMEADLVVGPETGVLNAMAMEDMAKIIFMSHSSIENLCRDWNNTAAFAAENVECYPCHRLHQKGFTYCNRAVKEDYPEYLQKDAEGGGCALCQVVLDPDVVWPVFKSVLDKVSKDRRLILPELATPT
jgi:ADP-heptose:LPS heptosyltransferase